jgi:hypothetical protein
MHGVKLVNEMKVKGFALALALCLGAIGCGGGGSSSGSINIRTVMLVRGSTQVTVSGSQSGNLITMLAPPVLTGFEAYSTSPQTFTATDVGVSPNVTLASFAETNPVANNFYTLYVTGIEGSATLPPSMALVQETPPTASTTASQIRFCNFSTSIDETVDVYVTPVGANPSTTATFAGVAYGTITSYQSIVGGSYVIKITPAGNSATTLYTSGATTFQNGLVYTNYGGDSSATQATLYSQQDLY